jgi:hypothetical protein
VKCGLCEREISTSHYIVTLANGNQSYTLNAHTQCLEARIDNTLALRRLRIAIFDSGWRQAELPI